LENWSNCDASPLFLASAIGTPELSAVETVL
jgi:hypothetical protein